MRTTLVIEGKAAEEFNRNKNDGPISKEQPEFLNQCVELERTSRSEGAQYKENVLFVCSANTIRSPTAERICKNNPIYKDIEFKSCGIFSGYPHQLNQELIDWADLIFVMDMGHVKHIRDKYGYKVYREKVYCMGISDEFDPDQPELIELIEYYLMYLFPDEAQMRFEYWKVN